VTFKNGDPFNGVCLSIKLDGIDTSFLLRNELTKVGVEMSIKAFSPNVESVEIVKRTEKRKRRARLYYMRCVLFLSSGPSVPWALAFRGN
jgi:ribosomal protein L19